MKILTIFKKQVTVLVNSKDNDSLYTLAEQPYDIKNIKKLERICPKSDGELTEDLGNVIEEIFIRT